MNSGNGDKLMIGELKGQVEMIIQRMEKMEHKIDNIEQQLIKLNNFDAKIIGAAMAIATIVSIVINYIR